VDIEAISDRKSKKAGTINFLNEQNQMFKDICQQAWIALSKKYDSNQTLFVILLPYYDVNPDEVVCYFSCDRTLPYNSQKMEFDEENKCFTSALDGLPEGLNYAFNFKCTWKPDSDFPEKDFSEFVISSTGIRAKLIKIGNKHIKDTNIIYFPEKSNKPGEDYKLFVQLQTANQIDNVDIKNVKIPNINPTWKEPKGHLSSKIEDTAFNLIRPRINIIYLENLLAKEAKTPLVCIKSIEIFSKTIYKEEKTWSNKYDLGKTDCLLGEIFLSKPFDIKKNLNESWKRNEELQTPVCSFKNGQFVVEPLSVYSRLVSVTSPDDYSFDIIPDEDTIFYAEIIMQVIGTVEIQIGLELGKKGEESSFYNYSEGVVVNQSKRIEVVKVEEDFFKYIINSEKATIVALD